MSRMWIVIGLGLALIHSEQVRAAGAARHLRVKELEAERASVVEQRNPAVDTVTAVDAAMSLWDHLGRLLKNPGARLDIQRMFEQLGLTVTLNFRHGMKGTRKVRRLAGGIIQFNNEGIPAFEEMKKETSLIDTGNTLSPTAKEGEMPPAAQSARRKLFRSER